VATFANGVPVAVPGLPLRGAPRPPRRIDVEFARRRVPCPPARRGHVLPQFACSRKSGEHGTRRPLVRANVRSYSRVRRFVDCLAVQFPCCANPMSVGAHCWRTATSPQTTQCWDGTTSPTNRGLVPRPNLSHELRVLRGLNLSRQSQRFLIRHSLIQRSLTLLCDILVDEIPDRSLETTKTDQQSAAAGRTPSEKKAAQQKLRPAVGLAESTAAAFSQRSCLRRENLARRGGKRFPDRGVPPA
jgi:hypothetical protein